MSQCCFSCMPNSVGRDWPHAGGGTSSASASSSIRVHFCSSHLLFTPLQLSWQQNNQDLVRFSVRPRGKTAGIMTRYLLSYSTLFFLFCTIWGLGFSGQNSPFDSLISVVHCLRVSDHDCNATRGEGNDEKGGERENLETAALTACAVPERRGGEIGNQTGRISISIRFLSGLP